MEGEVGAQVAPSVFFRQHQALPGSFHEAPLLAKKRDFPWKNNPNFPHGQEQEIQRHRLLGSSLPSHGGNWNPRMWDWDGVRFTAQPSTDASEVLHLGSQPSHAAAAVVDQRKGDEGPKDSTFGRNLAEDDQNLSLKLGGGAYTGDEPAARPNKRVRSGLPGSSGNYPMCQVDDCKADLSSAKDYHKRHKVCEVHSKTAKALVGKQMQRFCQQCSRFHPLSEFDEGKRSCRRRLAGHNRRRRKTQPEDASSKLLPPRIQESTTNGNLDIVNLLAIFAHLQGNNQVKPGSIPPLPDQDRLVQLISKLSAPNNANPSSRSSIPVGSFDLNVSQVPALESFEQSLKKNSQENAPSTTDLLTALSAALAASAPNGPVSLSQGSSESSGNNKAKIQNAEPPTDVNSHNKSTHIHPSTGVLTKKCTDRSGVEVPCRVVHKARQSLPLQLFGPADDESPTELGSMVKYLSSESSNPMEERSPSSSPPVTKKLFPLHSTMERQKYAEASECQEDNATIELSVSHGRSAQLQLFKESDTLLEDGAVPSVMHRAGYKSSGSDHSPSSSNSDAQDRTGRITFKLFGKDPSCFPDTLRTQVVFSWLSNSPSEMESYIRPGCVVLSIYLSMPSIAWEELDDDLLQRVTSLVQYSDTEFWRNGRFLVSTNKQLVSHKDGKIRLSKSWRAWSAPELTSISPVAIVGGQETSLVLKGRNLTVPGTKIHCAYMGKYISKVLCSAYPGTIYDDSCVERFDFPGGSPRVFGRCFIEVENGFKGNSFPVIIADASICQELRALESDIDEDVQMADAIPEEQVQSSVQPRSREDVMHFLNELGWLFQRTNAPSSLTLLDFSITRFKYLFTFSVERDWCNLIKTLLDILVERSMRNDALEQESLEMLSEVHLLIRAVNRKSKQMIDLLLHYCVCHGKDATKVYLFPPNMSGPGGMTPLHMAASMQDAEDIVDALTNDPQEVGINCWNSILDDSDQSPYMYATLRNNLSYNRLVARKLADRTNGQVTISVVGGEISMDEPWVGLNRHGTSQTSQLTSCAQCALMGARPLRRTTYSRGLLQRPYVHSMLAIAAVCVCVCLFFRGSPQIGSIEPFKWENLDFGPR
ncbi:unnamed protein product [Musa acuminata subsp. malaccensis]|uniref:(wild Malaysian banana) hypothetical protein n=1 Tax=Musa acuminata subsp. malaccensis TaxID=214687 RepID=A0A8D7FKT7_MUSAM|nr:unnamed protein product [Musa acuminata subsp. malaccensis]